MSIKYEKSFLPGTHDEKNMCPLELSLSKYRGIKVSASFFALQPRTNIRTKYAVGSKVRTFLIGPLCPIHCHLQRHTTSRYFRLETNRLFELKKRSGVQFFLTDNRTKNQKDCSCGLVRVKKTMRGLKPNLDQKVNGELKY